MCGTYLEHLHCVVSRVEKGQEEQDDLKAVAEQDQTQQTGHYHLHNFLISLQRDLERFGELPLHQHQQPSPAWC